MISFLVASNVEGEFHEINHKILSLLAKDQKFEFLLLVGRTFSLDSSSIVKFV